MNIKFVKRRDQQKIIALNVLVTALYLTLALITIGVIFGE